MNISSQNEAVAGHNGYRIGAVSFFNARPLIYRLQQHENIFVQKDVPARLGQALDSGSIDAGLVPSIDYQESQRDWLILPDAAIGSCGEVLTVRVFSQVPLERIDRLACDTDSHTSVVLAQIIWQLRFHHRLSIEPLTNLSSNPAVLLIGDKVLPQLGKWPFELDLGAAWTELTNLPFVYAFWAVSARKQTHELDSLANILQYRPLDSPIHIDEIVTRYAKQHGFDPELAKRYFTENISYEFGSSQRQGLNRFYQLAYQMNLIPNQDKIANTPKPLNLYTTPTATVTAGNK